MRGLHRGFGGRNRSGRRARGWIVKAWGVEGGGGKLGKLIDQMDGFIMGRRREDQVEKERGKKDMKERGGNLFSLSFMPLSLPLLPAC